MSLPYKCGQCHLKLRGKFAEKNSNCDTFLLMIKPGVLPMKPGDNYKLCNKDKCDNIFK